AALEAIDRAAREGEDLLAFTRDVIELLRLTLVLKAAPNAKPADLTHTEGNELRKLGEAASLDELLYVLRAFLEADALMRGPPQRLRLPRRHRRPRRCHRPRRRRPPGRPRSERRRPTRT